MYTKLDCASCYTTVWVDTSHCECDTKCLPEEVAWHCCGMFTGKKQKHYCCTCTQAYDAWTKIAYNKVWYFEKRNKHEICNTCKETIKQVNYAQEVKNGSRHQALKHNSSSHTTTSNHYSEVANERNTLEPIHAFFSGMDTISERITKLEKYMIGSMTKYSQVLQSFLPRQKRKLVEHNKHRNSEKKLHGTLAQNRYKHPIAKAIQKKKQMLWLQEKNATGILHQ